MSRKVTLRVNVTIKVRDRDVFLLAAIESHEKMSHGSARVSAAQLAEEMDVSVGTLRHAVTSCQEEGYLEVKPAFASNGGQLENVYSLTTRGRDILRAAREDGLLMP